MVSSQESQGIASCTPSQFAKRLEWLNGTALGSPVVPEVAKITAREESSALPNLPLMSGRGPSSQHKVHKCPCFVSSSPASFLTSSERTRANGSTKSSVPSRASIPDLTFSGTILPLSFQTARDRARIIGQFGIRTTSRCPS